MLTELRKIIGRVKILTRNQNIYIYIKEPVKAEEYNNWNKKHTREVSQKEKHQYSILTHIYGI